VFIADKLFILVKALLLDVLPCFGFSRNKAVLFVTGTRHQGYVD
jgi:hypothetical protein